jgi:hypothetical protein
MWTNGFSSICLYKILTLNVKSCYFFHFKLIALFNCFREGMHVNFINLFIRRQGNRLCIKTNARMSRMCIQEAAS